MRNQPAENQALSATCRWTLLLSALFLILNLGLFFDWDALGELAVDLQFDGSAISRGEAWRLLTGNVVHWDVRHFLLDGVTFLVLGVLYERHFPRGYPWLVLSAGLAVGLAGWLFWPAQMLCRGLSGINAAQYSSALSIEFVRSRRNPWRWLWVGPAAAIFATWLIYGSLTGRFFLLGRVMLGDAADSAALAHVAGGAAGIVFFVLTKTDVRRVVRESRRSCEFEKQLS